MKHLIAILFLIPILFGFTHNNHRVIRVALLDTGINSEDIRFKDKLCPEIGEDFTGEGLNDTIGHGTHVAGLIKEYAKNTNYCLIMLKYYSETSSPSMNTRQYVAALDALNKYKPDVVNLSLSGPVTVLGEKAVFANMKDVKFFAAAGNETLDLDKDCSVYPACYSKTLTNITVVGNKNGPYSNFGNVVKLWIDGNNIESDYPYALDATGRKKLSGSSMSTAIATGTFLREHY